MKLEEGYHCRYQIRYHCVWKVKYSRKILFGERIKYLKQIIQEIAERYDYYIEAVGIDDCHVHVFAGAHPAVSPAKLIQVIKSITARELFKKYPEIKQFLWGGAIWAIGYYVRTVSDGPLDHVIKRYIDEQNQVIKSTRKKRYQLKLVP
ncbi:IS200/IS605 family transposase [Candidatus Gottesmanbacteria bacterium]|nr:IS200/IS605 family transposase [Candidatus Gottesmanbacteria bacterium]